MRTASEIGGTLIIASLTTMVTLAITGLVRKNKKINNSISKDDLEEKFNEAKDYTDSRINDHEKLHKSISENFNDIRKDNERIEGKVDKILFLLAKR